MKLRPQPNPALKLTRRITLLSLGILATLAFVFLFKSPPAGGPGYIISGSNTVLNPDGGDYMSNLSGDVQWTLTSNEYTQFEELAGTGGANLAWERLSDVNVEPTGLQVTNDTRSGGSCGNADITVDADGGQDYAYYSIIDPDVNVSGDEILALAIRIADETSGNFSFSFLVDALNDCGGDTNAVCGNPCFEYEIQAVSTGDVNIFNIDGCSGTSDCDARNGTLAQGGKAFICNPCNMGTLQVEAGSGACTKPSLKPVFWMAHVNFSDLAGVDPQGNFKIAPASTTSSNSVIYKGTNVADYGGIGDPNDSNECDCTAECLGSSCTDCERDCALSCAANLNFATFPVEFLSFQAEEKSGVVHLNWFTASESNNDYFEVERKGANGFEALAKVKGVGNSQQINEYSFVDKNPPSGRLLTYRLKQVDVDGKFSYSSMVELQSTVENSEIRIFADEESNGLNLVFRQMQEPQALEVKLLSISGANILSSQLEVPQGNSRLQVNTGKLTRGWYIALISDVNGNILKTEKLSFP